MSHTESPKDLKPSREAPGAHPEERSTLVPEFTPGDPPGDTRVLPLPEDGGENLLSDIPRNAAAEQVHAGRKIQQDDVPS